MEKEDRFIFRLRRSKRGVSPVVASALLLMLTVVLAVIIFLWARGWMTEQIQKFGRNIEEVCSEVDFDANLFDSTLEIVNRGNFNINKFEIKYFYSDGSKVESLPISVDKGKAVSRDVYLDTNAEKIQLFPVLLGSWKKDKSNYYTCLEQGKFIK